MGALHIAFPLPGFRKWFLHALYSGVVSKLLIAVASNRIVVVAVKDTSTRVSDAATSPWRAIWVTTSASASCYSCQM